MKRVLEKVSWKTRRVNLKFYLFNLDLHDHNGSWGFCFFRIEKNFNNYSLLSFKFRLPNKTTVKNFTVDEWDILFVRRFLFLTYEDLCEKKIWGNELSLMDRVNLNILEKLFK